VDVLYTEYSRNCAIQYPMLFIMLSSFLSHKIYRRRILTISTVAAMVADSCIIHSPRYDCSARQWFNNSAVRVSELSDNNNRYYYSRLVVQSSRKWLKPALLLQVNHVSTNVSSNQSASVKFITADSRSRWATASTEEGWERDGLMRTTLDLTGGSS